jgi:hypothetical protein
LARHRRPPRVGKDGELWAFDPSAESYQHLLKNLSLNHCGDAYRYLCTSEVASGDVAEVVPVMSFDLYASQHGITHADYIEVDVEGAITGYLLALGCLKASPNGASVQDAARKIPLNCSGNWALKPIETVESGSGNADEVSLQCAKGLNRQPLFVL